MGSGGVPNRTITITNEKSLNQHGKPNSRIDRFRNGKKVQSRWYNNKGQAVRNRDYSHSGKNITFPHDHAWEWNGENGQRGVDHLTPDYDNFN